MHEHLNKCLGGSIPWMCLKLKRPTDNQAEKGPALRSRRQGRSTGSQGQVALPAEVACTEPDKSHALQRRHALRQKFMQSQDSSFRKR